MERNIYLSETFCGVEENGRLVEFYPAEKTDQTGQILKGKVERMVPGLEAAFIQIGRKKAGFLPLKENSQTFQGGTIQSGDRIMVQIKKEENVPERKTSRPSSAWRKRSKSPAPIWNGTRKE